MSSLWVTDSDRHLHTTQHLFSSFVCSPACPVSGSQIRIDRHLHTTQHLFSSFVCSPACPVSGSQIRIDTCTPHSIYFHLLFAPLLVQSLGHRFGSTPAHHTAFIFIFCLLPCLSSLWVTDSDRHLHTTQHLFSSFVCSPACPVSGSQIHLLIDTCTPHSIYFHLLFAPLLVQSLGHRFGSTPAHHTAFIFIFCLLPCLSSLWVTDSDRSTPAHHTAFIFIFCLLPCLSSLWVTDSDRHLHTTQHLFSSFVCSPACPVSGSQIRIDTCTPHSIYFHLLFAPLLVQSLGHRFGSTPAHHTAFIFIFCLLPCLSSLWVTDSDRHLHTTQHLFSSFVCSPACPVSGSQIRIDTCTPHSIYFHLLFAPLLVQSLGHRFGSTPAHHTAFIFIFCLLPCLSSLWVTDSDRHLHTTQHLFSSFVCSPACPVSGSQIRFDTCTPHSIYFHLLFAPLLVQSLGHRFGSTPAHHTAFIFIFCLLPCLSILWVTDSDRHLHTTQHLFSSFVCSPACPVSGSQIRIDTCTPHTAQHFDFVVVVVLFCICLATQHGSNTTTPKRTLFLRFYVLLHFICILLPLLF